MGLSRQLAAPMIALSVFSIGCSATAAGAPLDQASCAEIAKAWGGVVFARTPEAARPNADTLETYGPPEPVRAAIEYYAVNAPNPQQAALSSGTDDPNAKLIDNWLTPMCPMDVELPS